MIRGDVQPAMNDDKTASNKLVVVVFCRDRPSYLRETLRSIQGQEYQEFDIIISDNSRMDENARLNQAAVGEYSFPGATSYVRQTGALTMCGHFFKVRDYLSSAYRYLAIHNDDDVWMPAHLSTAMARFAANPRCVLTVANAYIVDGDGKSMEQTLNDQDFVPPAGQTAQLGFWLKSWYGAYPGYVLSLDFAKTLPVIDNQQIDVWMAIWASITNNPISYITTPTFYYRRHATQMTLLGQNIGVDRHRLRCWMAGHYFLRVSRIYPLFFVKLLKSRFWLWQNRDQIRAGK